MCSSTNAHIGNTLPPAGSAPIDDVITTNGGQAPLSRHGQIANASVGTYRLVAQVKARQQHRSWEGACDTVQRVFMVVEGGGGGGGGDDPPGPPQ